MLEALISLRRTAGEGEIGGAATADARVGDILAFKPFPASWGVMERRFNLIALFDAEDIEWELAGGYDGVMGKAPLSRWDWTKEGMLRVPVERGAYRVDIAMFAGSPGLDPTVECGAVAPNGKPCLKMSDLITTPMDAPNNKAVLLDSGGKKSELAKRVKEASYDVVDRITFTVNGMMWRHGIEVPPGNTGISIDDLVSRIREFPNPFDLVEKGVELARALGANYVIHGNIWNLPFVTRAALSAGVVIDSPLLDWTENEAVEEAKALNIEWVDETLEVEGEHVEHGKVR